MIVDEDTGTSFQRWYKRTEDVEGVFVRVVVEDPAEEVDWFIISVCREEWRSLFTISAFYRLSGEEVMRLEHDSLSEITF